MHCIQAQIKLIKHLVLIIIDNADARLFIFKAMLNWKYCEYLSGISNFIPTLGQCVTLSFEITFVTHCHS